MSRCNVCGNSFEGSDCPTCQTVTGLDLSVFTEGQAIYVRTSGVPGKDSPASLEEASTRRKFALAFPLCKLGRDPANDVVVNGDDSVSRFHAEIAFEDGAFYVNDKGSTNGTFLNGKPVIRRTALADGDRVRVGRLRFKFLLEVPMTEDGYRSYLREPEDATPVLEGSSKLNMTLDMAMPDDVRSKLEEQIVGFDSPDNRTVAIPKKIANLITELEDLSPFPGSIQANKAASSSASSARAAEAQTAGPSEAIPLAPPPAPEPSEPMAVEPEPMEEPADTLDLAALPAKSDELTPEARGPEPTDEASSSEASVSGSEEVIALGAPPEEHLADVIARAAAAAANGAEEPQALEEPEPVDSTSAIIAAAAAAANGADDSEGRDAADVIARAAAAANGSEEETQEPVEANVEAYVEQNVEENVEETTEASEDRQPEPTAEATPQEGPEQSPSEYQPESTNMERDFPRADAEPQRPEPAWCDLYLPDELGSLQTELAELNEVVVSAQQKIREVENRIALTRGLRGSLLAGRDHELRNACGRVLELLGWGIKKSDADAEEITLTEGDTTVAIGRIVWTTPDALYQHLGKLAMAQVAHWCQHRSEPAGVLIVNTFGHESLPEGKEAEFSEELEEFARRKNVCVMTTLQMLCIYKELDLGNAKPDTLRQAILATTGRLPGYKLEPTGALVTV